MASSKIAHGRHKRNPQIPDHLTAKHAYQISFSHREPAGVQPSLFPACHSYDFVGKNTAFLKICHRTYATSGVRYTKKRKIIKSRLFRINDLGRCLGQVMNSHKTVLRTVALIAATVGGLASVALTLYVGRRN